MLFFISVTIFADALVLTVPTRYLQFFEDIEGASKFAWGAATLAFLYLSLGKACTLKQRHSGSGTLMQCWSYEHIMHMRPMSHNISPNLPRAKRWEPSKKYHSNLHNLMPPIKQEFDNLQPNEPDEVISADRQDAFETVMCLTTLIFDDIAEPYMPDRTCGHRDWQNVNADKIHHWLSRHERMMPDIQVDTDNGLPLEEYKALYNLVPHPLIHNVANLPKDILQPHNQEEEVEDVVPAHKP
ncbi:hypothetical protein AMTR_s00021p00179400 [Amborella trichopoda]|uniref:Aminotransferase-like plant mobile domain-containing protein n=1 Tax=Amborella trichopoda TaxID=13333 RepID=W1Q0M6_AMBTC|nr:hypothetical protein AMTR_s00021p00179400 [Amborella trichopoda]